MNRLWSTGLVFIIVLSTIMFTGHTDKNLTDEEKYIEATTSKYCYDIGEEVIVTLTNIGNKTIYFSTPPYLNITNESGATVYSIVMTFPYVVSLDPLESMNLTWDQKYWIYKHLNSIPPTGDQVPPGKYFIWAGNENGYIGSIDYKNITNTLWDIAQIQVGDCLSGPVADAGPDQIVDEGDKVFFNGTGYDPGSVGEWIPKTNIPIPRRGGGSATLNGEIYYAGGDIPDSIFEPTVIVHKYNPAFDTWYNVTDMPAPRIHLGAAAAIGKIYAIGGSDGNDSTDTVFEFDPNTNNWTSKAPLPIPMESFGIASVNDKIYVIGGSSTFIDCYPCGSVYEYNPLTDSWSTKTDIPTGRANLATAVFDDKIYAIGGEAAGTIGTVEVYDPSTDTWTTRTNMTIPRSSLSAETLGGRIYAFGGTYTWGLPMNVTEMYNPPTDSWTNASPMLEERVNFGSGVVGNCMYAIAGGVGGLLLSQAPDYTEEYCLGGNITLEWDFDAFVDLDGDGDYTNDNEATGPTPTHIYGDNGDYIVTLTVTNNIGKKAYDSMNVTVLNVDPTAEIIRAYMTVDITLRLAGEKWHDATMYLYEDGIEIGNVTVVRSPGNPDEQSATIEGVYLNLTKNYSAKVVYTPDDDPINGQPNGATPAWIILTFEDGSEERIHHTFNVKHPDTWVWNVDFSQYIMGNEKIFEASAHDEGSDDLTFIWNWSISVPEDVTTYYNNAPVNTSDPYPSPDGVFPFEATDIVKCSYTGIAIVILTVHDDDGGSTITTISLP